MDVHSMPKFCACGKSNSVDHALSCMKGGFSVLRHNNFETPKQRSSEAQRGAQGLWSGLERTLCDVRIFHPGAPSYRNRKVEAVYKQHEDEKKNKYLRHVLETEKCSFTLLVFSTHGGCAPEADKFHKRVATLLAKNRNILYSKAISYVRRIVRFSILCTTLMAIRGYRGTGSTECQLAEEDLNLIPRSAMYENLIYKLCMTCLQFF